MKYMHLCRLLPSMAAVALLAGCGGSRAIWIPEDSSRALPVAAIDKPEVKEGIDALQAAVRLAQDPAKASEVRAQAEKAIPQHVLLARSAQIPREIRGLATYNKALAMYLVGDLAGAAAAADIAQGLLPEEAFIATFANRLERELARERVEGYRRLVDDAQKAREQAVTALAQARNAESLAQIALVAARDSESKANLSSLESRKVADDAMRKLAIATQRFDITIEDVKQADAEGKRMLAGILTEALLRSHGNDPEVLAFLELQIAKEFTQSVTNKDLAAMQSQLGAWAEALRIVQGNVGTVDRAKAVAASLEKLNVAQQQIYKTQQELWTTKAKTLLEQPPADDVAGLRRQSDALEAALVVIPPEASIRVELEATRLELGKAISASLTKQIQERILGMERRLSASPSVAVLQELRIDAAENQAVAIDGVARDGIDRGIATKATTLKDQIEAALQIAALRQTQEIADADAVKLLNEVEAEYVKLVREVNGHPANPKPDQFWSRTGAALSLLERKAMRVDGLCSSKVQDRAREEMRKVGELAGKVAILQRTSYNMWAMENIQQARKKFKEGEGWFNDDEAMFKAALKEFIGPIDTALLDPPVMSMYRAMFDKLFSEIDLEDQVDVSKSMVDVPSRPLSAY